MQVRPDLAHDADHVLHSFKHHNHEQEEHDRRVREAEERARQEAEEARRWEEEMRRQAEEARRQQEEAQRREEEARRREDEARRRTEETKRREEEARRREEEANRAAEQMRRDLEETRRRDEELRKREEEARRREDLARQLAEENKRIEQEARQREGEAQAREAESKRQEEEARKAAIKAQEEEERAKRNLAQTNDRLSIGIQPVVWPTEEEFNLAQARIEYNSEKVHLAICGSSGAGKSSLINAFRGFANRDDGAAPAGIVETTMTINRYPDARAEFSHSHFVWFDAPGAGTLDIPDWQYFNEQGLFIFDVIVLVYDIVSLDTRSLGWAHQYIQRFTAIDVAIIQNCERYRIPLYIVRSKADTHIMNIMENIQLDSDEEDTNDEELYKQARQIFINFTRGDFEKNLQKARLTKRDVFIVSSIVMRALVTKRCNSKISNMTIDEARLLEAVMKEAYARLDKDYSTVVKQNMIRAGT